MPVTTKNLSEKVYVAIKAAFTELLSEQEDESFYTFGIFSDDGLQFVHPVANTEEALGKRVEYYRKHVDDEDGFRTTCESLRWCYGDWGHFPDVGKGYFNEINQFLVELFDGPSDVHAANVDILYEEVLKGFLKLETEGFFGDGMERSKITLLLVGDIPDELVERWVIALNPELVAQAYLSY